MSNLDKFQPDRDSRLDQLFGDIPLESEIAVELPSESRFYKNASKTIVINPIKFEDEKNLATNLKNKINPINLLISKCVKGVDVDSLLLIDKLYLLLKIREISYGDKYPARISCEKCGTDSEVNIDLSKLIIKNVPQDISDPREITLPKLKKKAEVRFPRVSDEAYLLNQEQIYNNIWRFVSKLDGIADPVFISKAIPKMHIMDIKFILSNIMRQDLGLDPKFIFECGFCNHESNLTVPINENFFLVT